jgi:phage gpG-like protein
VDYVTLDIKWPTIFKKQMNLWSEVAEPLAASLQTNRGFLFMNEGQHNGHEKWKPLKHRDGQILSDSGDLSKSIAPEARDNGMRPGHGPQSILRIGAGIVTIGSGLAYAAMMNWGTTGLPGGVLRPKNKKALAFRIGRNFVVCKSVKIPARRFDTFTKADETELQETLVNTIEELFNG